MFYPLVSTGGREENIESGLTQEKGKKKGEVVSSLLLMPAEKRKKRGGREGRLPFSHSPHGPQREDEGRLGPCGGRKEREKRP